MTDASTFDLLPAIDLLGGRVVRLREGDFERVTAYGDDPGIVARAFVAVGAVWIHVVDLDGARAGERRQAESLRRIVAEVGRTARVQAGGGLRTQDDVVAALEDGAARVVVGTAALRDPAFSARLVEGHGAEAIVVAIDVRDGLALGEGWRAGAAGVAPDDAIRAQADAGITMFAVTAIEQDGLLEGPDLRMLEGLVALDRGRIIASGGVTTVADLLAVRSLGCAGAIVGRALYEGRFSIEEAVAALR